MEDLDPEEALHLVDPALKLLIEAVHRYEGYVTQSTGDGIFASFGVPDESQMSGMVVGLLPVVVLAMFAVPAR